MGITSAAEAKLDARIRPEIAVLRSRTSYPKRARAQAARRPALAVLPGGADVREPAARPVRDTDAPAGPALDAAVVKDATTAARPVVRKAAVRPARAGEAVSGPEAVSRPPGPEAIGKPAGPGASSRAAAGGQRPGGAPERVSGIRAPAAGRIRLTRRGRVVVGALLALAVAGLAALIWLAIAGQAEAAGPGGLGTGSGAGRSMLRVVVRPGETLWSIAVRTDPAADPRVVIQEIMDDNALRGTAIQAGQVLWVPRSGQH